MQSARGEIEIQFDNKNLIHNVIIHFNYGDQNVDIKSNLEYYQGCPDHNVPKFSGDAQLVLHGIADSGIYLLSVLKLLNANVLTDISSSVTIANYGNCSLEGLVWDVSGSVAFSIVISDRANEMLLITKDSQSVLGFALNSDINLALSNYVNGTTYGRLQAYPSSILRV